MNPLDKLREVYDQEPVLLLLAAAALVALGVDLPALAGDVERLVDALVVLGGAAAARAKVTPESRARVREQLARVDERAALSRREQGEQ